MICGGKKNLNTFRDDTQTIGQANNNEKESVEKLILGIRVICRKKTKMEIKRLNFQS
jgi:hypothetical protein